MQSARARQKFQNAEWISADQVVRLLDTMAADLHEALNNQELDQRMAAIRELAKVGERASRAHGVGHLSLECSASLRYELLHVCRLVGVLPTPPGTGMARLDFIRHNLVALERTCFFSWARIARSELVQMFNHYLATEMVTNPAMNDSAGGSVSVELSAPVPIASVGVEVGAQRQRRIDDSALPGQAERFQMADKGYTFLTGQGYVPVGFDHFALPGDSLAQATVAGRLHRNFQGFTEDPAPVLIGLGASAISCFPDRIVQNEKNAGRYRMLLSQDHLSGVGGVRRSAMDQELGAIINGLMCQGAAQIGTERALQMLPDLAPFLDRGLATLEAGRLSIAPGGLPYVRTMSALFDPYRQDSVRRFSSAV